VKSTLKSRGPYCTSISKNRCTKLLATSRRKQTESAAITPRRRKNESIKTSTKNNEC
jgi:hypothetical protein